MRDRDREIADRLNLHRTTLSPDSTEGLILEVAVEIRDRLRALESSPVQRWREDVLHDRPHRITEAPDDNA